MSGKLAHIAVALGAAALLLAFRGRTLEERAMAAVGPVELAPVPGEPLRESYSLAVLEVPEPPADLAAPDAPAVVECPIELRGIVAGDEESFAILGWKGGSGLVRAGEGVRTSAGWVAITEIAADHVMVRFGDAAFRCNLPGGD